MWVYGSVGNSLFALNLILILVLVLVLRLSELCSYSDSYSCCCDSTKGVNRKFKGSEYIYIVSQHSGTEIYIHRMVLTTP